MPTVLSSTVSFSAIVDLTSLTSNRALRSAAWVSLVMTSLICSLARKVAIARNPASTATTTAAAEASPPRSSTPPRILSTRLTAS